MLNQSKKLNYKQSFVWFNKNQKLNSICVMKNEERERFYDHLQFCDFLRDGKCQEFKSLDEDKKSGSIVSPCFCEADCFTMYIVLLAFVVKMRWEF